MNYHSGEIENTLSGCQGSAWETIMEHRLMISLIRTLIALLCCSGIRK